MGTRDVNWKTKQWLESHYWDNKMTLTEMAAKVDVCYSTIRHHMNLLGVKIRSRKEGTNLSLKMGAPRKPLELKDRAGFEYLIGVLHGDGCVIGNRFEIAVGFDDEKYCDELMKIIKKTTGLSAKKYRNKYAGCFYTQVFSANLADKLKGYKDKKKWTIPDLEYPEEYLAGLFDTDGYITSWGGLAIAQKDLGNLENIVLLFEKVGIPCTLRKYVRTNGYKTEVISIRKRLLKEFSENIPIKHPRKIEHLAKYIVGGEFVRVR